MVTAGAARIVAAFATLFTVGCSVLLSTSDREQCTTTADCEANPALKNRVCQQGICVLPSPKPEQVSVDAGGCVSTDICERTQGRGSVCRKAGEPCVSLVSEECKSIGLDGYRDPSAIIVGTLLPMNVRQWNQTDLAVPYSDRQVKAIDLGLREWVDLLPNGLPIAGSPTSRPLAVLHCDTHGDPETAKRAFRHLTDVVGVQSVIVGWDEDLAAIAPLAAEKKTAIVCSDCLVGAPPGPAVWRILPDISGDAALVAWRVADLESKLAPAALKVVVLSDSYRVGVAFAEALDQKLVIDGKPASDPANAQRFLSIKVPDPRVSAVDFANVVQKIVSFGPNVVVAAMASDFPKFVLPEVELGLASAPSKPHYVLTQLSWEATPFDPVVTTDDLRLRISGTRPYTTSLRAQNIASFEVRYKREHAFPADGTFSGYEAFYALAYGIASASVTSQIDGPQISLGFHSLVSGATIDIGPAGLLRSGLDRLNAPPEAGAPSNHGTFDLRGFSTELDWDVTTGEVAPDMALFCFERQNGALVVKNLETVRWSPQAGVTVSGDTACK